MYFTTIFFALEEAASILLIGVLFIYLIIFNIKKCHFVKKIL